MYFCDAFGIAARGCAPCGRVPRRCRHRRTRARAPHPHLHYIKPYVAFQTCRHLRVVFSGFFWSSRRASAQLAVPSPPTLSFVTLHEITDTNQVDFRWPGHKWQSYLNSITCPQKRDYVRRVLLLSPPCTSCGDHSELYLFTRDPRCTSYAWLSIFLLFCVLNDDKRCILNEGDRALDDTASLHFPFVLRRDITVIVAVSLHAAVHESTYVILRHFSSILTHKNVVLANKTTIYPHFDAFPAAFPPFSPPFPHSMNPPATPTSSSTSSNPTSSPILSPFPFHLLPTLSPLASLYTAAHATANS